METITQGETHNVHGTIRVTAQRATERSPASETVYEQAFERTQTHERRPTKPPLAADRTNHVLAESNPNNARNRSPPYHSPHSQPWRRNIVSLGWLDTFKKQASLLWYCLEAGRPWYYLEASRPWYYLEVGRPWYCPEAGRPWGQPEVAGQLLSFFLENFVHARGRANFLDVSNGPSNRSFGSLTSLTCRDDGVRSQRMPNCCELAAIFEIKLLAATGVLSTRGPPLAASIILLSNGSKPS
uniref:Uncharacterized protein n=1 Tax=Cannabis sativa TaxID=3483 RepID=A0A803Q1P0_CANSA